jgi:hypothetical protein
MANVAETLNRELEEVRRARAELREVLDRAEPKTPIKEVRRARRGRAWAELAGYRNELRRMVREFEGSE